MKNFYKNIVTVFIAVGLLGTSVTSVHAAAAIAWPSPDPMTRTFLDEMETVIRNTITAQLKHQAIKEAIKQLEKALNSDTGSPRVIEDFDDYLHGSIEESAKEIVINNFHTDSLRGRTTGNYEFSDYLGNEGVNKTYFDTVLEAVTNEINGSQGSGSSPADRVADYCEIDESGNIAQDQGNHYFDCFAAVADFNPLGEAIAAGEQYRVLVQREQENKFLMATSSGVLPAIGDDGKVKTPNIITEEFQKAQVYLPLDQLTNATTMEEIVSVLINEMISKYINEQFE